MRLSEVLSYPVESLWRYLKNKTVGSQSAMNYFVQWIENSLGDINKDAYKAVMSFINSNRINMKNISNDDFEKIYGLLPQSAKNRFLNDYSEEDQLEQEPWVIFSPNNKVPDGTWLIHYGKDAEGIWKRGFTRGIPDYEIDKLAWSDYFEAGDKPGYNFAFIANSDDAYSASYGRYGNSAVMFCSSGISVYHREDEENQVIFWGTDVKPSNMAYITKISGAWGVVSNANGNPIVYQHKYCDNVQQWVMDNWNQYRNVLSGGQ